MAGDRNRILVEGALAVALSVIFSALRLWSMPQGGSITLEMVPRFIFALRRGGQAGCMAGAVSGMLQFITGGYGAHPLQVLLDYPAAFGLLGIAGFFPGHPMAAMALAGFLRFGCHVLAGVVFFASFAPEGSNIWVYASVYNGSFLLPTLIVVSALVRIILPRLQSLERRDDKRED